MSIFEPVKRTTSLFDGEEISKIFAILFLYPELQAGILVKYHPNRCRNILQ
jgi:hypothetical protein